MGALKEFITNVNDRQLGEDGNSFFIVHDGRRYVGCG